MITVLFLRDFAKSRDIGYGPDPAAAALAELQAGGYDVAAEVDTPDINLAYGMMQNGLYTDSWTLEPVPKLRPVLLPIEADGRVYGNRSASVGDVFECGRTLYLCAPVGWKAIPWPDDADLPSKRVKAAA